jgi:Tfp pilus assembly protein PilP
MEIKKLMILAVSVVLLVGGLLYWVLGGGNQEDRVTEAVNSMAVAIATGNRATVSDLISRQFKDAGMDYKGAVEEFSAKRQGMMILVEDVAVNGNSADVTYSRKEMVDKKPVVTKISKERWSLEEDGKWRLARLSTADRTKIPRMKAERLKKEDLMKAEVQSAEAARMAARNVSYTPFGKRDPFESLILEGVAEGPGTASEAGIICDPKREREFLEGFDLALFKVTGIVISKQHYALLEAQNGHGYTIKQGMHIGTHCGKVVEITSETVLIAEKHLGSRGIFETKNVPLMLRERSE